MDPVVTLIDLLRALENGDGDMAKEYLDSLYQWIDKGGFLPKPTSVPDSVYADGGKSHPRPTFYIDPAQVSKSGNVVEEELVHPYCGNCGHRYFNYPKVPASKAAGGPCRFCLEDQREEGR